MFAYCLNDPVMGSDPTGEISVTLGLMLGGGVIGRDGANSNMQLSNVIKNTSNTIARVTRRANRSYAAKVTASALAYRNNYVSNSAVNAYTRFWAGCTISNVASHVVDVMGG